MKVLPCLNLYLPPGFTLRRTKANARGKGSRKDPSSFPFSNSGHLIILAWWNAVAQMSGSPAGEHTCSVQETRPVGRQGHCHWAPPPPVPGAVLTNTSSQKETHPQKHLEIINVSRYMQVVEGGNRGDD